MRLKLSLWLMLFVSIIMILSACVLFFYFKKETIEGTEIRLSNWANQIEVAIAENPSAFHANPENFLFSSARNEFTSGSLLVQFMDPQGHLLAKSPGLTANDLPFSKTKDVLVQDIKFTDGVYLKTYQDTVIVNKRLLGYVIVGIPTTQAHHNLNKLRDLLIVVVFCTLVILGGGIYLLVSINVLHNQKLFLSFASHELRTPLAVILGHTEVALRRHHTEEAYKNTLKLIKNEADWMSRLISNLLFVFRSESGTEQLNKTTFHLGVLLTESASTIKKQFPNKKITLTLPEEGEIFADEDRLKQVIHNLLENAAKNTHENGCITLTLTAFPTQYKLEVKDNGIGIPPDTINKIFDPFYRVDTANKEGMGLGLAISKWIIQSHNGIIQAHSTPGQETIFTIWIPNA